MKAVAVLLALVAVCRASGIGLSTVQVNAAPLTTGWAGNVIGARALAAPGIIGAPGYGLAGLAPLGYAAPGYGLAGLGLTRSAIPVGVAGLSAVQVNAAPYAVAAAPYAVAAAPYAVAAAPAGAVSVNANRGSVHVAPLPGHIVGSQQLNLSPAPGTW